jgi:hypothetical protein
MLIGGLRTVYGIPTRAVRNTKRCAWKYRESERSEENHEIPLGMQSDHSFHTVPQGRGKGKDDRSVSGRRRASAEVRSEVSSVRASPPYICRRAEPLPLTSVAYGHIGW